MGTLISGDLRQDELLDRDSFEELAWDRMEQAYAGFLRSLWREEAGFYAESMTGWLGKYHIYRNIHRNWASDEDRHRAARIVDYYLDPERFGPRDWVGHPAGVWLAVRFLCLAYRHRERLALPEGKADTIRSTLGRALEAHLWTKGPYLEHTNQEVYDLYLTDAWHAFRAFGEDRYWEWVLHFLAEIKERHNRPFVDDLSGRERFRFLQPDLTFNYACGRSTDGHPQNLHTPNYHDTHIGELICAWQEIQETKGHEDPFIDEHIRLLESFVFYDWMYDGSPSYFSSGYGPHRIHHGLTWASMLVFPVAIAYRKRSQFRGVGRFLLEQFVKSLPRYDVMEGDPADGAIPAAYFGTRHFCGMKGEGNAFWLKTLSKALVEYRIQDVEPERPESWTDFRDWNQGMHFSGQVFDLGVIGYQVYRESDGVGMQTSLGEPTIRDARTGRIVVASSMDPPNFRVPESGADFLLRVQGQEPIWLTEESDGRRASTFAFHSSQLSDWQEHLTPYRCQELDGRRRNPHWSMVHTEVIRAGAPRFAGGNVIRATRDVVVQLSYLVNTGDDLFLQETGKLYSWMRDEEAVLVSRADGLEEFLGWHEMRTFRLLPEEDRICWFWARYAGYGMLFIPVWDEMDILGQGWRLRIDRRNTHLGKYVSQGLGNYSIQKGSDDKPAGPLSVGRGWRTCMVLRPTTGDLEEVRALASFYQSRITVEGDGVKPGARAFFVPGREIRELRRGDRPWDVVVEGVRAGSSFALSGPTGTGLLTVTLLGDVGEGAIRCAYDGSRDWQEVRSDRPNPDTAIFSLPWRHNRYARIEVDH